MSKELELKDLQTLDPTRSSFSDKFGILARAMQKRRVRSEVAEESPKDTGSAWVVFDTKGKKEYTVKTLEAAKKIASKFEGALVHDSVWWKDNKDLVLAGLEPVPVTSDHTTPYVIIDTSDNNVVIASAPNELSAKRIVTTAHLPPLQIASRAALKIVKSIKKQTIGKPFNGLHSDELEELDETLDTQEAGLSEVEIGDLDEALSAARRIKMRATMRKNASKLARGRRIALRRRPTLAVYENRAKRAARAMIFTKLAGGRHRGDLSYGQRAVIEKQMKNRKSAIQALARLLLPRIIKKDAERRRG